LFVGQNNGKKWKENENEKEEQMDIDQGQQ
jgi:hypothetical protein